METTQLTTYTDFKEGIDEKKISRSSMVPKPPDSIPMVVCDAIEEHNSPYQKKSPTKSAAMTPKTGKENRQHAVHLTPKTNLMYTPTRLTRSALKLNNDGFATPRAPLSAAKQNMHRTNSNNNLAFKNTPNSVVRSKTQTGLVTTAKPFV
ncbi:uncharacterized protein LOC125235226 [Leguminivora glycinivorella]|nr:uncharacterized protein LOC125235226 [Leguminivora glycinivorella]XP_047997669.1 uncharacterized protein LOC125235226 [Leguminivora glycinivorella]